MKNTILTLGTIIAFIAGSTLLSSCGSDSQKDADSAEQHDMEAGHDHETVAATFACSMHPEITGKDGDKCSKCGMALVAMDEDGEMKDMDMDMTAVASCPMHPEITGKEGDKCSKCGMALTLADVSDDNYDNQH